jgi:hypothetical protein
MNTNNPLQCIFLVLLSFGLCTAVLAAPDKKVPQSVIDFYAQVMNAPAIMPADLQQHLIGTEVPTYDKVLNQYSTAEDVEYFKPDWEDRIAHDWQFFTSPAALGRVLVIDFKTAQTKDKTPTLAYRYLANQNSQDELYEPWSSSKIFAFMGAVAKARQEYQIGAESKAGDAPLADLITSINSYEPFGRGDGDSNAIATYLANVSGRDRLTALFHDQWLMLRNPSIRFRGAYATDAFRPSDAYWYSTEQTVNMSAYAKSTDDLGFQAYRCDHCGLTGNKPMTTLAQAEWLKRLAAHQRDPLTQQPYVTDSDVQVLFYGQGHSDQNHQVGGMMQGISLMLHHALATAISGQKVDDPKTVLDAATAGKWRIFQKIGWGDSETRGTGENVVLAHVVLPGFQGGKEFTIAAQTSVPGSEEIYVNYAGINMQALLTETMQKLLLQASKTRQGD